MKFKNWIFILLMIVITRSEKPTENVLTAGFLDQRVDITNTAPTTSAPIETTTLGDTIQSSLDVVEADTTTTTMTTQSSTPANLHQEDSEDFQKMTLVIEKKNGNETWIYLPEGIFQDIEKRYDDKKIYFTIEVSAKKKKLWKTKEAFEKDFGLKIGTEIRNCKEYTVSLSIWLNNELASLPGSNENATKVQRFTNQPDETKFSLNSTTPSSLTFNIDDGANSYCLKDKSILWCTEEGTHLYFFETVTKYEQVSILDLWPNTFYSCSIRTSYSKTQMTHQVAKSKNFKTSELNWNLTLIPLLETISLTFGTTFNEIKGLSFSLCINEEPCKEEIVKEELITIKDLKMASEYKICVKFRNNGEECEKTTTLEGPPYPPANLSILENTTTLSIQWDSPEKYCTIEKYLLSIEMVSCVSADFQNCHPEEHTCWKNQQFDLPQSQTSFELTDKLPYRLYEISIRTENTKGKSDPVKASRQTEPECVVPNFTQTVNATSAIFTFLPFCSIKGPQKFSMELFDEEGMKIESVDGQLRFDTPYHLENLRPETKYNLRVDSEIRNCSNTVSFITTEEIPVVQTKGITEDSIEIRILKSTKSEMAYFTVSIESTPLKNDSHCKNEILTKFTRVDYKSKITKKKITDLNPFHSHTIRVRAEYIYRPGTWSEPVVASTPAISSWKISTIQTDFYYTTSVKTIMIFPQSICPFPGYYSWNIRLYKQRDFLEEKYIEQKLDGLTKLVFKQLDPAEIYSVCIVPGISPYLNLENFTCKNVSTSCLDLPQPTKSLSQVSWREDGNVFDPFRTAIIKWSKDTFDNSNSGKLQYFASYSSITKEIDPYREDDHFYYNVENLEPNTTTSVTISAYGCDQHNVSLNITIQTKAILPATASLLCDSYTAGNVLLRVEDSLDNLKFGKTQAYFLGSNNFTRSESGSFLQESDATISENTMELCNMTYPKDDSIQCFWIQDFTNHTFVHVCDYRGEKTTFSTELDPCPSSFLLLVCVPAGILAVVGCIGFLVFTKKTSELYRKVKQVSQPIELNSAEESSVPRTNTQFTWTQLLGEVEKNTDRKSEFSRIERLDEELIQTVKTTTEAQKWLPQNDTIPIKKNRYTNILAYDDTRVCLQNLVNGSNYINANWIRGFSITRKFIATQGPLAETIPDFWQMVFENNVEIIVMLTKLQEIERPRARPKIKCEKYWPDLGKTTIYGGYVVKGISEKNSNIAKSTVLRTFEVSKGLESKTSLTVHQIHFDGWPDHGVPKYPQDLIYLHKEIQRIQEEVNVVESRQPSAIVVHCSAGVGRTGTLIGLDTVIHQIDSQYETLDLLNIVFRMRQDRCKMVQHHSQYHYLHECAAWYLRSKLNLNDEDDDYYECSENYIQSENLDQ